MSIGYVLGVAVAIPIGFWMGRSETAFQMFDPIVNALYSIPTIAFVPFLIVWFGLFLEGRAALVFVMVVFDVIVTVSGEPVRSTLRRAASTANTSSSSGMSRFA